MGSTSQYPVLMIGLDGLEISYAEQLMAEGAMPNLAALKAKSAQFLLDHGSAQRTGLAWEHVASGLSPADGQRWSAVDFNPRTYDVNQKGATFVPFLERLPGRSVVFDPPYVDLRKAPRVEGVVGWGAHDPGTDLVTRPVGLYDELKARFGDYPSPSWIYCCPAYSVDQCKEMGEALVKAVEVRREAALWLLAEKFDTCDLFYVVTGELHSAIEGLWHGIDPNHPLHNHPSAPVAAQALKDIHQAVDRLVGDLIAAVGDRPVLAFAMGGMGPNESDLQSMVLLPELLYRHHSHQPLLSLPQKWTRDPGGVPHLAPHQIWSSAKWFSPNRSDRPLSRLERGFRKLSKILFPRRQQPKSNLFWQPALSYQKWWPQMAAFALPSFYDGRIRINLAGREQQGIVDPAAYDKTCDQIEALVHQCRDPRTGEPVVARVERPQVSDPRHLDNSDADLVIVWQGMSNAFDHPDHGLVGPVPFRRTGGHTGIHGMAYLAHTPLSVGDHGVRDSFDVVPTLADLMGSPLEAPVSGHSWLTPASSSGVAVGAVS